MNDAEIMELVDEVRRCERAVQQAKNALEVAKRDAAVAACPYKEGDIVSGWDRDGTSPAKVDKILFTPSYTPTCACAPSRKGANHPEGTGTHTTCWM